MHISEPMIPNCPLSPSSPKQFPSSPNYARGGPHCPPSLRLSRTAEAVTPSCARDLLYLHPRHPRPAFTTTRLFHAPAPTASPYPGFLAPVHRGECSGRVEFFLEAKLDYITFNFKAFAGFLWPWESATPKPNLPSAVRDLWTLPCYQSPLSHIMDFTEFQ